jgi:hypothetical protein
LDALMDVLDPDVVGWTDSGGVVAAPRRPAVGRRQVAEQFLRFVRGFRVTLVPMPVNASPAPSPCGTASWSPWSPWRPARARVGRWRSPGSACPPPDAAAGSPPSPPHPTPHFLPGSTPSQGPAGWSVFDCPEGGQLPRAVDPLDGPSSSSLPYTRAGIPARLRRAALCDRPPGEADR